METRNKIWFEKLVLLAMDNVSVAAAIHQAHRDINNVCAWEDSLVELVGYLCDENKYYREQLINERQNRVAFNVTVGKLI